jgi:polysaccharide biosynthesis transport protein
VTYEVGSIIRRAQVGDRLNLPAGRGESPPPTRAMTPLTESHPDSAARQPNFRDYLRILKRRWIALALTTAVVTAGAVVFSLHQQTLYEATAQVLINRQDIASVVTNTPNPTLTEDPGRYAATQASIARSSAVVRSALARAGVKNLGASSFLANSSVTPSATADTLGFEVRNPDSAAAARLVNAYAAAFAAYKLDLDTAELQSARNNLNSQIAKLVATGDVKGVQYRNLVASQQQLHTMQLLQARDSVLTHPTAGTQVQPSPKRDGLLGIGFGLVLGIGFAFALDALDRRVRNEDEVEEMLDLPLLARLPKPAQQQRERARLSMIEEPRGAYSDSIRRLATSISFVNPDSPAQVLMITSSVQQEGKSTTIANLAVALARAGHDVALVDLDLRQPTLSRLFGIHRLTGVTDVAIRRATLDAALVNIGVAESGPGRAPADAAHASQRGSLYVLPTGPLPASPSEFLGSEALASRVLTALRERFEYVLIDSPPICVVADTSVLTSRVDGILAVTRLGTVERPALRDLKRELAASPAPAIGVVITGAEVMAAYGYSTYFQTETPPSVRSENDGRANARARRQAQRTRARSGSSSG